LIVENFILNSGDHIVGWLSGCELMDKTLSGSSDLTCMEPGSNIQMEMKKAGQLSMSVNITPDNPTQQHQFRFDLDQSYLPPLISGCREVLRFHPLKGKHP
jgi:hypothetical protein